MSLTQDQLWQQQNSTDVPVRVGVKRRLNAPYQTVDSLYNLSSTLYWNGAPVITGSGGSFTLANNQMFIGVGGVPTAKTMTDGLDGTGGGYYTSAPYFATFYRTDGATLKPGRVTTGYNQMQMWQVAGQPLTLQPQHRLSSLLMTGRNTSNLMNIYPTVKLMSAEPSNSNPPFVLVKGYGTGGGAPGAQGYINDVADYTYQGIAGDTILIDQRTNPALHMSSEGGAYSQFYSDSDAAAIAWAGGQALSSDYRSRGQTLTQGAFYTTNRLRYNWLINSVQTGGTLNPTDNITASSPLNIRCRDITGTAPATQGKEQMCQGLFSGFFTDAYNAVNQGDLAYAAGAHSMRISNDLTVLLGAQSMDRNGTLADCNAPLANVYHLSLLDATAQTDICINLPNFQTNDAAGFTITFYFAFANRTDTLVYFRSPVANGVIRYGTVFPTDQYADIGGPIATAAARAAITFTNKTGATANTTPLNKGRVTCVYEGTGARVGGPPGLWHLIAE